MVRGDSQLLRGFGDVPLTLHLREVCHRVIIPRLMKGKRKARFGR
jgi:hypothetical protein